MTFEPARPVEPESLRTRAARGACLALVLAVAIVLRFTGLSWGLRHPPHTDEQDYVENTAAMLDAGDLDHRFYRYPGGFFYLLALPLLTLGPDRWHGPDAYLLARGVVSAFGVLNVLLLYGVGRRLLGTTAGLVAAALLAVSPVDVETSHQVRPDILLVTFGILALLVFSGLGNRRADVRAGVLVGVATAIKFTGLLMVPYYVVARLLAGAREGQKGRELASGLGVGLSLAVLIPIASTPYALVKGSRYAAGPRHQLFMYYQGGAWTRFPEHLAYYLWDHRLALGLVATVSALLGLVCWLRRDIRAWGPRLLHPLTNLIVMATAVLVFPRLILPAFGVVVLLAATPVALLVKRRGAVAHGAAAALGLFMLWEPARASWRYARDRAAPSVEDQAVDWLNANAPAGARILETRMDANLGARPGCALGVDVARFRFLERTRPQERASLSLVVPEMDYVITGEGRGQAWAPMLEPLFRPAGPSCGVGLQIQRVADSARPRYVEIDLSKATLTRETGWLRIDLPSEIWIGYVALGFGERLPGDGSDLRLSIGGPERQLGPARRQVEVTPGLRRQLEARKRGARHSLERRFILRDPVPVRAVRVEWSLTGQEWSLTEVALGALSAP